MAPKRKLPLEEPVAASSSEEEETSSSTEGEEAEENEAEDESGSSAEEEEEEEEEEPKRPTPAPAKQTKTETLPKKQVQKKPEPEPEPATESESDSDSEQPSFTVKPIASKPMENPKPRPKSPASSPPAKQTPAKRGSQVESDSKETKRSKKKDVEHADAPEQPEDATKTNLFQRVWSEADEIHVLEGLIRFKEEKGTDPTKNMDSYFDYIKKKLNFDVSLSQLKDKVWRLKRKYQKHKGKNIQKPHERQAYDLWERIWGDIVESSAVKANGNAGKSGSKKAKLEALKRDLLVDMKEDGGGDKKEVDIKDSGSKEVVNYGNLNVLNVAEMEEYVMKRGLDFAGPVEKAKMQEEWKKLHIEQLKFLVKKNELVNKQVEMMLAAYEAGES